MQRYSDPIQCEVIRKKIAVQLVSHLNHLARENKCCSSDIIAGARCTLVHCHCIRVLHVVRNSNPRGTSEATAWWRLQCLVVRIFVDQKATSSEAKLAEFYPKEKVNIAHTQVKCMFLSNRLSEWYLCLSNFNRRFHDHEYKKNFISRYQTFFCPTGRTLHAWMPQAIAW